MSTQTKHTPGPWFCAVYNLTEKWFVGHQREDFGTDHVCELDPRTNGEADARLIASAPTMADTITHLEREKAELLKALDDILEQTARTDAGVWLNIETFKDYVSTVARAAIANATGKVTR